MDDAVGSNNSSGKGVFPFLFKWNINNMIFSIKYYHVDSKLSSPEYSVLVNFLEGISVQSSTWYIWVYANEFKNISLYFVSSYTLAGISAENYFHFTGWCLAIF